MTTGAARVRDSHCQYSNCSAGTIAIAITGTASTTAVTSRSRRGRNASAGSPPCAPGAGAARTGSGSRAVYPVASTVAISSGTETSPA